MTIELEVYIRYRRRRFYCAKGANISSHGMFLEVRNLTLPTGTMIELELRALGRDWLIPGLVVHRDTSGVGVMFREAQSELLSGLSQIPEGRSEPLEGLSANPDAQSGRLTDGQGSQSAYPMSGW